MKKRLSYLTLNDLRGYTLFHENFRLLKVCIHRNFYQSRFFMQFMRPKTWVKDFLEKRPKSTFN